MKHRENKFFHTLAFQVMQHEKEHLDDGVPMTIGGVMLADLRMLMFSSAYDIVRAYGQCSKCTQRGVVSDGDELFCANHGMTVLRERRQLLEQIAAKFGGADG